MARRLRLAHWPQRSPALGVMAWQALTISVVMSIVLAGAALALPSLPITTNMAQLLRAVRLCSRPSTPLQVGRRWLCWVRSSPSASPDTSHSVSRLCSRTRRRRTQQRRAVELVARPHDGSDSLVVDHSAPLVYCLPGRRGRVVFTTGAWAVCRSRSACSTGT